MQKALKTKLATFVIGGLVAQFFVMGYVLVQSYEGRVKLVNSQRDGCGRAKLDRKSMVIINQSVSLGFTDTDSRNPNPMSEDRIKAEADLKNDLPGLMARSEINCKDAFPSATFSPTRGTITP